MQGVLIHASVRCTLIYKFQSKIKEDKVYTIQSFSVSCNDGSYRTTNNAYKINFQFGTKVNLVECTLVLKSSTTYTPFSTITAPGFDTDYLVSKYLLFFFFFFSFNYSLMFYLVIVYISVDVIGMFIGVGTERKLEKGGKKTKMNVIIEFDG